MSRHTFFATLLCHTTSTGSYEYCTVLYSYLVGYINSTILEIVLGSLCIVTSGYALTNCFISVRHATKNLEIELLPNCPNFKLRTETITFFSKQ